jgi:hypothetical protein
MRKIQRLNHLEKEQQRLRKRREEIENALRHEWRSIFTHLQPAALLKQVVYSCTAWAGKKILS